MASFILLTIPGCSTKDLASLEAPLALDLAPYRCAPVDPRAAAEFKRVPPAPKAGPVTRRRDQEWHDDNEAAIRAKNAAGRRLIAEYEKCRTGSGSAGTQTRKALAGSS
jgi:hypothetical protein